MLKKVLVIVLSLTLLISLFFFNRVPVIDRQNEYEVYLGSYSTSSQIKKVNSDGFKFILGIKGESFTTEIEEFYLEEFLSELDACIIFIENLTDSICYYGYSPKIKYLQMLKGKLINVHIVVAKEVVKVGFPIIYGSF